MNNAASTVMAILFTFAPHATAAGNLLVNPGFEAGDFGEVIAGDKRDRIWQVEVQRRCLGSAFMRSSDGAP